MKALVFTDNHFCQYSSIVRGRGVKYSIRLENQIESLNWVFDKAKEYKVDKIISLGDFFDSSSLNAEEITALSDICFPKDIPMIFLVGNHEMWKNDLSCSTSHLFQDIGRVIDKPEQEGDIAYLPYVIETERQSLTYYFNNDTTCCNKPKIIFSHNDIRDINYGAFVSHAGFSVKEIHDNCDLFINGHLHNGQLVEEGIINVGNLTGQNFSEDASRYPHCIMIVDTDTLEYQLIENPYAFNFYKLSFPVTQELKGKAVCTLRCKEDEIQAAKEWLKSDFIIGSRLIVDYNTDKASDIVNVSLQVDHIQKFVDFIHATLGTSDIIDTELAEVIK